MPAPRDENRTALRREAVVRAGLKHFAHGGYDDTTMRRIATESGMLAGSIYHHFGSKEALFLEVHAAAIEKICSSVLRAIDPCADPWTRLVQAAQGYLESMLKDRDSASIMITEAPRHRTDALAEGLIAHRKRFEDLFLRIVADLPLRKGVDRTTFRLAVLGMLAWTYIWYREGGSDSPRQVAAKMLNLLRDDTHAVGHVEPAAPVAP